MKGWHDRDHPPRHMIFEPVPAQAHDAFAAAEHVPRGNGAQQDDDFGRCEFDVAAQERKAGRRLLRRRVAIAGRPPVQDIGDVDIGLPVEPDGGKHPIEQFSRAAHEGQPCGVLVLSGRLADEEDAMGWGAIGKDSLRRMPLQRAPLESFQSGFQIGERRTCRRQLHRLSDRILVGRWLGGRAGRCGRSNWLGARRRRGLGLQPGRRRRCRYRSEPVDRMLASRVVGPRLHQPTQRLDAGQR